MSNNHIDPDLALEVFILEPETSDALDEHEVMLNAEVMLNEVRT